MTGCDSTRLIRSVPSLAEARQSTKALSDATTVYYEHHIEWLAKPVKEEGGGSPYSSCLVVLNEYETTTLFASKRMTRSSEFDLPKRL